MSKVDEIKSKLDRLPYMKEDEIKSVILETLELTRSEIRLDDLRQVLPNIEYRSLESRLNRALKENYTDEEISQANELSYRDALNGSMQNQDFFVVKTGSGGFALRRYDFGEMFKESDFSGLLSEAIPLGSLKILALNVFRRHKSYNVFHTNKNITSEEIPDVLECAIRNIETNRNKDISKLAQEVMTELRDVAYQDETEEQIKESLKEISGPDISEFESLN